MSTKTRTRGAKKGKNGHDKYCWTCHTGQTEIQCCTCFRSFHQTCMDPDLDNVGVTKSKICSVCIMMRKSKDAVNNRQQLKLLKYVITDVMRNPNFLKLKNSAGWQKASKEILVPIDLSKINNDVKCQRYSSIYAFIVDVKCLYHNCACAIYSENPNFAQEAYDLLKFCTQETEAISSCTICYENKRLKPMEWRTIACNKQHLLLWAKLPVRATRSLNFWPIEKGFKYWPAKFISGTANRGEIKVIFFDDDKFVNISQENCQLYTTDTINEAQQMDGSWMAAAIEELKQYAANVQRKFNCRFVDTLPCTPFDLDRIKEHTKAMFSGYDNSLPTHNNFIRIQDEESTSYGGRIDNIGIDENPAKKRRIDNDRTQIQNEIIQDVPDEDCADNNTGIDEISAKKQRNDHENDTLNEFRQVVSLLSSTLLPKFEVQQNEWNALKGQYANSQRLNKELNERLKAVISERNQLKMNASIAPGLTMIKDAYDTDFPNKLMSLTEESGSLHRGIEQKNDAIEHDQKKLQQNLSKLERKNNDLQRKLLERNTTVEIMKTLQSSEAKRTMDVVKNDHAREMKKLNQSLKQLHAENQTLMVQIEVMNSEHSDTKNELVKANEKIATLKRNHKNSAEQLRENLEIGHRKMMKKFQEKLEKEHQSQIDEIREQHQKNLRDEVERAIDDYKKQAKTSFTDNE
ncbi:zinc finger MYND domain-containing protein 11-like [Contarinia nasturtii]|uniref:zinc finger MYND domain-containing protein 11-like n=1 Tax=Contarinia nasturtii TaxID=265458 RepID=UPI0012D49A88|nr:zinc finger MYND domain-containing protein 11-like [Contarinia nasturtii]